MNYLAEWNFLIDAEYGSSAFTDISVDMVYTVYRSQSGLLIRAEPKPDPIGYESTILEHVQGWISGK